MTLRLCQTSGSLNSILSQFFSPTHLGVVKTSNLVKLRYRDVSSGPNSKSRKPRTQGAIARYPAKASLRARRPMRRRFVAVAAACPSALMVFIVRPHRVRCAASARRTAGFPLRTQPSRHQSRSMRYNGSNPSAIRSTLSAAHCARLREVPSVTPAVCGVAITLGRLKNGELMSGGSWL